MQPLEQEQRRFPQGICHADNQTGTGAGDSGQMREESMQVCHVLYDVCHHNHIKGFRICTHKLFHAAVHPCAPGVFVPAPRDHLRRGIYSHTPARLKALENVPRSAADFQNVLLWRNVRPDCLYQCPVVRRVPLLPCIVDCCLRIEVGGDFSLCEYLGSHGWDYSLIFCTQFVQSGGIISLPEVELVFYGLP